MFIEVIPFGGSIDNKWLTYYVRDELAGDIRIGCLVEVPFRNAVDYAIVTKLESSEMLDDPKSIVRIITGIPLLAPYQVRMIFGCSSYYFVHIHQILSLFLSKSLVRYLEKKDFAMLVPCPIADRYESGANIVRLHHHMDNSSFLSKIQECITGNTAIIFPDDFAIENYLGSCGMDAGTTLVIQDRLTETKKYKAFCSVYNGEKNIIIWTRRILYYNLSHYNNILYIEDALCNRAMRFGHTYKHLEILRRMAMESDMSITILSTLPSVESMYLLREGIYEWVKNRKL